MRNSDSPLVSVILCVHNDERFIEESVRSIINQTYLNWELILINDGSTDNTSQILKQFISDPRIRVYKQDNVGLTKSLNLAINYARGDYLARQDSDDISDPERIEKQVNLAINNPNALITSDVREIDELGHELRFRKSPNCKKEVIDRLKKFENPLVHGSVLIKKDLIVDNGCYNEKYRTSQDFELWVRLFKFVELYNSGDILYSLRRHTKSVSYKRKLSFRYSMIQQLRFFIIFLNIIRIYKTIPLGYFNFALKELLVMIKRKIKL